MNLGSYGKASLNPNTVLIRSVITVHLAFRVQRLDIIAVSTSFFMRVRQSSCETLRTVPPYDFDNKFVKFVL